MNKRGKVFIGQNLAGVIEEREGLCIFTYDSKYLVSGNTEAVSLTLPLRAEPYTERTMIPFFDGLIPEGWMLNLVTENWKVDARDRMSLLLLVCHDTIGNVSVRGG